MAPKQKNFLTLGLFIILVIGSGFYLYQKDQPFSRPSDLPSVENEGEAASPEILSGFDLPTGFNLSIFSKNISGARVIEFTDTGDMLVSSTSEGKIFAVPDRDNNGMADKVVTIASGLSKPHGIAFRRLNHDSGGLQCGKEECELYVAETNQISVYQYVNTDSNSWELSNKKKIVDLPAGGSGHFTRTIRFGPDERLYVSIGSTCNACNEKDPRNAAIYSMKADGSDFTQFAQGLRNTVFFDWSYVDGRMWGTDMGRDNLGDDLPPDEINILEEGKNYGWPICYGKRIHDTNFDKNVYIQDPCNNTESSQVDLQAHSAPLGLAFIPEEGLPASGGAKGDQGWPEEYWYNLLVAYHGSWNRSTPTGYKIARIKLDAKGKYLGTEDFISGWLTEGDEKTGRPVDIKVSPGGTAFISDDEAGVIYRLWKSE